MNTVMDAFMEKVALSPALMARAMAGRAAQGVGGAAALGKQVAGAAASGATSSRQVMGQLGGLGKHRLSGVVQGGVDARRMQGALNNPVTQRMQGRVHSAIKAEAAGAPTRTGQHLSKGYEGYMTGSQRAYSPQHMGQVVGTAPIHMREGTTSYMKSLGSSAPAPSSLAHAATMPAPAMAGGGVPSIPGPARLPAEAATRVTPVRRAAGVVPVGAAEAPTAVSSARAVRRAA